MYECEIVVWKYYIIEASLSKPHKDELNVRKLYIIIVYVYGMSVTRTPQYRLYSSV